MKDIDIVVWRWKKNNMFDDFDCFICPEEMNEEEWNEWCRICEEERS